MSSKLLLVDDDPNVLAGYRRQLRKGYHLETAGSAAEGLALLAEKGPFAVIISDMRMPEMDGITFLAKAGSLYPESVRMMLTGNADMQTCIDAVNKGEIFRFLTKPCAPEDFVAAVDAGLRQYELIMAEKEILHGTLTGAINVLTDILSVASPPAFGRATRMRRYVRHMAAELGAPRFWEYELAATLSQIGTVVLPAHILLRLQEGKPLTEGERRTYDRHPAAGSQLLSKIPRLDFIAQVVLRQARPPKRRIVPSQDMDAEDEIDFGAQLLSVASNLDELLRRRLLLHDALTRLQELYGADFPPIEAMMSFEKDAENRVRTKVTVGQLSSGMIAAENICAKDGTVLLVKGDRITEARMLHLQSCAEAGHLAEPFLVEVVEAGP